MGVATRPDLLVLDEVGYLLLEAVDATFLFQVISRRHEAAKIALRQRHAASARHPHQQQELRLLARHLPDPALATALLDRLLERSTTVNIRTQSYGYVIGVRPDSAVARREAATIQAVESVQPPNRWICPRLDRC